MLLRFGVANYLSMCDRQELSLVASALKDIETGLIDCASVPSGRVLPSAVIYGANASGKSNFVRALRYMCSAVLFSHSRGKPGGGVPRKSFALDPVCAESPSLFDIDFIFEGVRYHYGFEATDEAFDAEWMHAYPKGRRQTLFERKSGRFNFGRGLRGRNRVIADLTRPNSLFLSAAVQNDHAGLSKIGGFFRALQGNTVIAIEGTTASMSLVENELDGRVIEFLSKIGTGVIGYRRREEEPSEDTRQLNRDLAHVF